MKQDIVDVFQQLYELGRGFSQLNQVLLTLLPKHSGASDYRLISLIHLIAKLFAKVLSLCLALGSMASSAQSKTPSSVAAVFTTTSCSSTSLHICCTN